MTAMDRWTSRDRAPNDVAALGSPTLTEAETSHVSWDAAGGLDAQTPDLRRIHDMTARLVGLLDVESVRDAVLEGSLAVLGTPQGLLWLADPGGGGLGLAAHRGLGPQFLADIQRVPRGSGVWDACHAQRRPVTRDGVEDTPRRYADVDAVREAGTGPCHAMPLITRRGDIVGVVVAVYARSGSPGSRQLRCMDLYAPAAANAIAAARLHHRVQRELEERHRELARERQARGEGEQANRVKDALLASVFHELRTPINTIMGWAHILGTPSVDGGTLTRGLEAIARNAEAQSHLLEDVLDASRAMSGQSRLEAIELDLPSVIVAAVDAVRAEAAARGVRLKVHMEPIGDHAAGDARRLQRVVRHLLLNAVKLTPSGERVYVRLDRAGDRAVIAIRDSGPPMAPDLVAVAFDPFRDADADSTTRARHALGLWIARHLVELHGGTVRAESGGEGHGAAITIELPLAHALGHAPAPTETRREPAPVATAAPVSHPPLAGVEILIVDDDQDALTMLGLILRDSGATVYTAPSVAEALRLARKHSLNVLVSDLAMPGEDGYSLIRSLRASEQQRQIPAIALTAYVRAGDRASALAAGFNLFVNKPVDPAELIAAIARLAARRPEVAAADRSARGLR